MAYHATDLLAPLSPEEETTPQNIMKNTKVSILLSITTLLGASTVTQATPSIDPATKDWIKPGGAQKFHKYRDTNATPQMFLQDFSDVGYYRGADLPQKKAPDVVVKKFIPKNANQSNGTDDVTDALQRLIDELPIGGVLEIPEGTFKVSYRESQNACLRIKNNHVVIRGAGIYKTYIKNSTQAMGRPQDEGGGKSVILFSNDTTATSEEKTNKKTLKKGYEYPTETLELIDTTGLKADDWVELAWTFNSNWITEYQQGAYWGGASGTPTEPPPDARCVRQIKAVTGNTITLHAPTRYVFKGDWGARVYKISNRLQNCGIENLSVGNVNSSKGGYNETDYVKSGTLGYDANTAALVRFNYTVNCFMRNVASFDPEDNGKSHMLSCGVHLNRAAYTTLVNVIMQKPQYGGGGGNGYMFSVNGNDNLFYKCTAKNSRHGFSLSHATSTGNVFYKCLDENSGWACGPDSVGGYVTGGFGVDTHQNFSHSNLWDNCTAKMSQFESFHRGTQSGNGGMTGALNTFWNTTGTANSDHPNAGGYLVSSNQGDYGYVIGTQGPFYKVNAWDAHGCSPKDYVESVGAFVSPLSLWIRQRSQANKPHPDVLGW